MWTYILQIIAGYSSLHALFQLLEKQYPVIIILLLIIIIVLIRLLVHNVKKPKKVIIQQAQPIPPLIPTEPVLVNSGIQSVKTITESGSEVTGQVPRLERFALFVDSKNLYLSFRDMIVMENLEEFIKGKRFDVVAFLNDVIGGRNCIIKKYYRGYPLVPFGQETPTSIKDKEDKKKFIKYMQSKGYDVPEGGVEVSIHGKRQEKGVDTLLTMDVLQGALEDDFDTVIIVSSDRDFLPLIERIKLIGKEKNHLCCS